VRSASSASTFLPGQAIRQLQNSSHVRLLARRRMMRCERRSLNLGTRSLLAGILVHVDFAEMLTEEASSLLCCSWAVPISIPVVKVTPLQEEQPPLIGILPTSTRITRCGSFRRSTRQQDRPESHACLWQRSPLQVTPTVAKSRLHSLTGFSQPLPFAEARSKVPQMTQRAENSHFEGAGGRTSTGGRRLTRRGGALLGQLLSAL
jgi:hypothetical protein